MSASAGLEPNAAAGSAYGRNGHDRFAFTQVPDEAIRLNLGAGDTSLHLPGFANLDIKNGDCIYPLKAADGTIDEIRASHVLEHFGHNDAVAAVRDWTRALRPGGILKIAVPNFEYIARKYLASIDSRTPPTEPYGRYIMGGQIDADDYHRTIFDDDHLRTIMSEAGLVEIRPWQSDIDDCAALPVSLNLQGMKAIGTPMLAPEKLPTIAAVMSMPRLAFSDNMFCAIQVVSALRLPFHKVTGAFWGQCLERVIEDYFPQNPKYILTIDYDSVFQTQHVGKLASLMEANPHIDALAPIQVKRGENNYLMGILQDDGTKYPEGTEITAAHFQGKELTRAAWAHFGLTIIRTSALRELPHPWFWAQPNKEGRWGDGRQDDDTYFWTKWREAGKSLYLANRVVVAHQQVMNTWPGADGHPVHEYPDNGQGLVIPKDVWQ